MSYELSENSSTPLPPLYDETDAEPVLFSLDAPEPPSEPNNPALPPLFPPSLPSPASAPPEPLKEAQVNAKPFVIELLRLEVKPTGKFRPDSTVQLTRALRTSGLLLTLPPDELKTLLWVLTFTTPNGTCNPTLSQLAEAMGVSPSKAHERLRRLISFRWKERPLLFEMPPQGEEVRFALAPALVSFVERTPSLSSPSFALEPVLAGREAIIAYSRAHYARPRLEVEATINRGLGHVPEEPEIEPTDPLEREKWKARKTLRAMGMTNEQTETLFSKYPFDCISRQLIFLPHRHAKNPLGFLLAAIEGDYEIPLGLRQETSSGGQLLGASPKVEPRG